MKITGKFFLGSQKSEIIGIIEEVGVKLSFNISTQVLQKCWPFFLSIKALPFISQYFKSESASHQQGFSGSI